MMCSLELEDRKTRRKKKKKEEEEKNQNQLIHLSRFLVAVKAEREKTPDFRAVVVVGYYLLLVPNGLLVPHVSALCSYTT